MKSRKLINETSSPGFKE